MPATATVTPAFYETAPLRFGASRVIPAQPEEVFAALADTESWPSWFRTITKAEWTSAAPHGVGSTRRVHLGPIKIDEQFIVWEPGKAWGFTFKHTTIPVAKAGAERVDLEPEGTGTRVTYTLFVDPLPGLGGVTKVLKRGIDKGFADGLKGLEKHLAAA